MAQNVYPTSDVQNNWASGGFGDIDEGATPSDSDFTYTVDNPIPGTGNSGWLEVHIGDPDTPEFDTGHIVRWRHALIDGGVVASSDGTGCDITVSLVQGTTVIASKFLALDGVWSWTADSFTLTTGEAANITDYPNLRIRFDADGGAGSPGNRRGAGISWAELETGDAPTLVTLTPAAVTAAFSVVAPVVDIGEVTLTPAAATAAFGVVAPTVSNVNTLTPAPATAAFSVVAPTVTIGAVTLTPAPVTAAFSVVAPSVTTGGAVTLNPAPVTAAFSVVAPTFAPFVTAYGSIWRDDDGVEGSGGATVVLAENGIITLGPSGVSGIDRDQNVRFRIGVAEGGGGNPATSTAQLIASVNGGAAFDVNAGSASVRMEASANFASGDPTTDHGLTAFAGGSFIAGEMEETDGLTGSIDLGANNYTIFEFCVRFRSATLSQTDHVRLGVTYGGVDLWAPKGQGWGGGDDYHAFIGRHVFHGRFRNDDGNESSSGATFLKAQDVNATIGSGQDIEHGADFRLRVLMEDLSSSPSMVTQHFVRCRKQGTLDWSDNIGEIADTNTILRMGDSTNLTQGAATTDHGMTVTASGSFVAGDQNRDDQFRGSTTIGSNDYIIDEWSLESLSAQWSANDVVEFSIVIGDTADFAGEYLIPVILTDVSSTVTLTPAAVTAAWSVVAPTISIGTVTLTPAATTAAWSIVAPTVALGAVTLTPGAVIAAWSVPAPTLSLATIALTPAAVTAAFGVPAPTVATGAITLTPGAVTAAFGVVNPTVNIGTVTLIPASVVAAFGIVAPTIAQGGVTLVPSAVTGAWSVVSPTVVKGGVTLVPAAVSATFSVPAPTLSVITTLTPAAVTAALSVVAPTVTIGTVTLSPAAVAAALSVVAPAVVPGAVTLLPTPITGAFSIPAPTVATGAVSLTPAAVIAALSVPAPTVATGPVTLTPAAVAAAFSVVQPTINIPGINLTPSPAIAAWSVPTGTTTAGQFTILAAPVTAAWTVPTATLAIGDILTPASTVAAFSVPAPAVALGAKVITASPTSAAWSVVDPTINTGPVAVSPTPVSAAWSTPGATIQAGAITLVATPTSAVWSVPTAILQAGALALSAGPTTAAFSVPAHSLLLGPTNLTPAAAIAAWTAVDAVLQAGATVLTPAPVIAVFTVVPPSVTGPGGPGVLVYQGGMYLGFGGFTF